jgi:type IV pilus assembly protein PilN
MRFNINLASQPYEAARKFRSRMTAAAALLAVLAIALIGYIAYQRSKSRDVIHETRVTQRDIQSLDGEKAQAQAILNQPANRDIADRSGFLNDLFARKSLSWTRVFTEMERIMPANIHVVSIKPDFTKQGDLLLHVMVATDSRDRAVELVRRMEKSNHFRQSQVVAEAVTNQNTTDQAAGPGNIQFDIASIYVPGAPDNDATPEEKAAAESQPAATPAPAQQKAPVHVRPGVPARPGVPTRPGMTSQTPSTPPPAQMAREH